jgi:hypothetical protein
LGAGLAHGDTVLYLSTRAPNTIAGVAFEEGDVVAYNMTTSTASLLFRGDGRFRDSSGNPMANGGGTENIDALAVLSPTTILLSTNADARLGRPTQPGGTLHFYSEDVVLYDIASDTATLYFDGTARFRTSGWNLGASPNLDAFEVLPNGHYLISTAADGRLGTNHLAFHSGDVVEYDPLNDTASLYFSQGLFRAADGDFGNPRDVDGVAINPITGNLLLSTDADVARLGNPMLSFSDGDIVDYDRANDTATLFFNQALFLVHCENDDLDAFDVVSVGFQQDDQVPEPLTLLAVGTALAGIAGYARRRTAA